MTPARVIDVAFEDGGAIMVVTMERRWWQFWRPRVFARRFEGERIG